MTPDRPSAQWRHPWRLAAIIAVWVALAALGVWKAVDAAADANGIVVTCQTVQVWDHGNLGTVTVTRTAGATVHTPGNALTVPYATSAGPVVSVATARRTYTVTPPPGCPTPPPSTTTTTTSTTTTAPPPPPATVPPSTTTTTASGAPQNPPVQGPVSSVPGPTVPPPPGPGTPPPPPPAAALPPAAPATPTIEAPRYTG